MKRFVWAAGLLLSACTQTPEKILISHGFLPEANYNEVDNVGTVFLISGYQNHTWNTEPVCYSKRFIDTKKFTPNQEFYESNTAAIEDLESASSSGTLVVAADKLKAINAQLSAKGSQISDVTIKIENPKIFMADMGGLSSMLAKMKLDNTCKGPLDEAIRDKKQIYQVREALVADITYQIEYKDSQSANISTDIKRILEANLAGTYDGSSNAVIAGKQLILGTISYPKMP